MKWIFKTRHKILCYLTDKITYTEIGAPILTTTKTEINKIADDLKISYNEVFIAHHALNDKKHIRCTSDTNNHSIVLLSDGVNAVIDEYWVREGQKESNDRIYDKTKWAVPLIALIGTFISIGISIYNTEKTDSKIKSLEKEFLLLKEQKK